MEMDDAPKIIDTQLVAMASNGDLNAIKYYNDLVGRGPNDKKAVDAMQFSKIVLEAVMKHVNPEQLKAISAEIELASKAINP
jgi:DNA-binding protein Fis